MVNLFLTAIIGAVLIAGVAFNPLLAGQFHMAYAQGNATSMSGNMTGNATSMSGNMTGNATSMSGNMTGNATSMSGNMTGNATGASAGNSVTIAAGSSVPSNGKFFEPPTLTASKGTYSYMD